MQVEEEKTAGSAPAEEVRALTGFKVSTPPPQSKVGSDILQWFLFVSSTLTSIFLYALDNTIVSNIVPVSPV